MDSWRLLDALVGVYVSLLFVTASALVRWEAIAPEFSIGSAVVVGLGIAAVVAFVAGTVRDLAERVTSAFGPPMWGIPMVYLPYLLLVPEPGSMQALVAGAGVLTFIPGIGITSIGNRLTNRRLREASTEIVAVTVGEYEETAIRRWLQFGKTLAAFILFTLFIGMVAWVGIITMFERPVFSFSLTVGLTLPTLFDYFADDDSSKITVTDMGVAVDQYINGDFTRGFNRWTDLDGYRLTDDTIELVRQRRLFSTMEFNRKEISDEAALVDGIRTYLPRLDEAGNRINEEIDLYT